MRRRHTLRSRALASAAAAAMALAVPDRAISQAEPLSRAHQLTHSITYDPSPSPDGRRLVYIIVVAGREQLFTMNVDGAGIIQLTHDDADHEDPAWSPDGGRIAFVLIRSDFKGIALMNPDGSGIETVSPPSIRGIHPHWSCAEAVAGATRAAMRRWRIRSNEYMRA